MQKIGSVFSRCGGWAAVLQGSPCLPAGAGGWEGEAGVAGFPGEGGVRPGRAGPAVP